MSALGLGVLVILYVGFVLGAVMLSKLIAVGLAGAFVVLPMAGGGALLVSGVRRWWRSLN